MKTCLITGATSGIGKATAIPLAKKGYSLILTGRNVRHGSAVIRSLRAKIKDQNFEFIETDLSSMKAVNRLAEIVKLKYNNIDVLINNAGARYNDFRTNEDSIELTFATNHLGHFLLTLLLLDHLKKSPSGRIINVSSSAHSSSSTNFIQLNDREHYDRKKAYSDSKLANILFTYELAKRLKDTRITVNAVNPGGVFTNLGKNNGYLAWSKHIVYHLLKRKLQFPVKAAESIFYLADSPEVSLKTGKYFYKKNEIKSSPYSYNVDVGKKLWELSCNLSGLTIKHNLSIADS